MIILNLRNPQVSKYIDANDDHRRPAFKCRQVILREVNAHRLANSPRMLFDSFGVDDRAMQDALKRQNDLFVQAPSVSMRSTLQGMWIAGGTSFMVIVLIKES